MTQKKVSRKWLSWKLIVTLDMVVAVTATPGPPPPLLLVRLAHRLLRYSEVDTRGTEHHLILGIDVGSCEQQQPDSSRAALVGSGHEGCGQVLPMHATDSFC